MNSPQEQCTLASLRNWQDISKLLSAARRPWVLALLFAALPALLYLYTRSQWLDDWDSVQFALGVEHFDLFEHRPHPPGYPLYIFSGWFLSHLLPLSIPTALIGVSCLAGGVFVAAWHSIYRHCFRAPWAALAALTLAVTPMTWMTATKALTDMPSNACMALELALALRARSGTRWLAGASLAGAAAAGFRPQNIVIALLILLTAVWRPKRTVQGICSSAKATCLPVFLGGCLLWAIPTLWLQSRLPEANGSWLAWPQQLADQWCWRLDKPAVFIGAGDWSFRYLVERLCDHFSETFLDRGFAFRTLQLGGPIAWSIFIAGWVRYFFSGSFCRWGHRAFWRLTLPWGVPYAVMIFTCLPGEARYYSAVMPLVLLPAIAGWSSLRRPWCWESVMLPLFLLAAAWPLAVQAHREPPPPVRLLESIKARHQATELKNVWLFLESSKRHAVWYAPACKCVDSRSPGESFPESAVAVYTDDSNFLEKANWPGAKLRKLDTFTRPVEIHGKHRSVTLYQVVKGQR